MKERGGGGGIWLHSLVTEGVILVNLMRVCRYWYIKPYCMYIYHNAKTHLYNNMLGADTCSIGKGSRLYMVCFVE